MQEFFTLFMKMDKAPKVEKCKSSLTSPSLVERENMLDRGIGVVNHDKEDWERLESHNPSETDPPQGSDSLLSDLGETHAIEDSVDSGDSSEEESRIFENMDLGKYGSLKSKKRGTTRVRVETITSALRVFIFGRKI